MRAEKSRKPKVPRPVAGVTRACGYRDRMRAAGMRRISLWVPDARSAQVQEEARRQALSARSAQDDAENLEFIASVADTSGWT